MCLFLKIIECLEKSNTRLNTKNSETNQLQNTIEYKKRMNKVQNMFGNIYR